MEIFRNVYIKSQINNHINYYNYHHTLIFNNYASYKSYKYKDYINKIKIYFDLNKDLEYYFNKLPKDTKKMALVSINGKTKGKNGITVIPEGVEEFTYGSVYDQQRIDFLQLPSTLKSLTIEEGSLDDRLLSGFLPENLEELTVKSIYFMRNIRMDSLPIGLKHLTLPERYNSAVMVDSLPETLKSFEILPSISSVYFNSFETGVFPHGLTYLSIGNYGGNPIEIGCIPNTVTTLKLYSFSQDISPIVPSSCTSLYTAPNQIMSTIPSSVTKLVYSVSDFRFDSGPIVPLNISIIPNSIRSLCLSSTQKLAGKGRLPDSITELEVRQMDQHTFDNGLPNNGSLKILKLSSSSKIEFNENHHSITDLKIFPQFRSYSSLPLSLEKLSYFNDFSRNSYIVDVDFSKVCPSLSVLSFQADVKISSSSYPDHLLALSIQSQLQFISIKPSPSLVILELYNCRNFNIDQQFLKSYPSLEHLILIDCNDFTIENPSQVSNLSIYIDSESYNSLKLKYTNDNIDEHHCLLDELFNYSKVINYSGKINIFSNLIKNKFNK